MMREEGSKQLVKHSVTGLVRTGQLPDCAVRKILASCISTGSPRRSASG